MLPAYAVEVAQVRMQQRWRHHTTHVRELAVVWQGVVHDS